MKPQDKIVFAKEFKDNSFWKSIMVPALNKAMKEARDDLEECPLEEVESLRAGIKMIKLYLLFPDAVIKDAKDDIVMEESRGELNTDESEVAQE